MSTSADATTSHGFPMPKDRHEQIQHERGDKFYIVRLSAYERDLLQAFRSGVSGRFCLVESRDGTHELVRYADD